MISFLSCAQNEYTWLLPNFDFQHSKVFQLLQRVLLKKENRDLHMHPKSLLSFEAGWVAPTNAEIAELKNTVGYSTADLASCVGMNPKHLRNYLKEANYIKGDRIQYVIWRYWLEGFGLVEPLNLKPERPTIRSRVFSHDESEWENPTIREFRTLAARSGNADSTVARILGMPEALVKNLLNSRELNLASPFHIEHSAWIKFIEWAGVGTLTAFLEPPTLPEESLRTLDDGFVPPKPRELRQFVAWTGKAPVQLAAMFGVDPGKLTYYMSNRSARSNGMTIDPKVFSVMDWRAPTFAEIRTFLNVTPVNPMELAQRLRLGKQELSAAMSSRNNEAFMQKPLDISQEDWFKLLDAQKIITSTVMEKLTQRENVAHYIPYSIWRVMLQAYGVVSPAKLSK